MPDTCAPTPAVAARRCRVASASALGSMTVTRCPSWARGTANMPLPPPTSRTRRGEPPVTTGPSAAQIAAERAGGCATAAGSVTGTRRSLVAPLPARRAPGGRHLRPAGSAAGRATVRCGSAGPVARVDQSAVEGTLLDQLEIEAHAVGEEPL